MTRFVATAFLDGDRALYICRVKLLSNEGHAGIAVKSSLADLQEKFGEAVSAPSLDLFLVVTSQMAGWMGAFTGRRNRPQQDIQL